MRAGCLTAWARGVHSAPHCAKSGFGFPALVLTHPSDVNKLLKQYITMKKMMKKIGAGGLKGLMRGLKGAMSGGGMPGGGGMGGFRR